MASDEASGGATRAPAPPTAMIYMEPGLPPWGGRKRQGGAGGGRRGSQPWLRRSPIMMEMAGLSSTLINKSSSDCPVQVEIGTNNITNIANWIIKPSQITFLQVEIS